MTPTTFRKGGEGTGIRYGFGLSSLGDLLVAAAERGLCAISLGDDRDVLLTALQEQFPKAELIEGGTDFKDQITAVITFVEQPRLGLDLPLDLQGTAFQIRVWQALRTIPPGETLSYSDLATRLGMPKGARAVASACAANKIAVAVPCHRVLGRSGTLTGYRWGLRRKRALLDREAK